MTDYVLTLLVTGAALIAPAPLALRLAASSAATADRDLLSTTLRFLCWWCGIEAAIAIFLGAVGHLSAPELCVVELAVFLAGWALRAGSHSRTDRIQPVAGPLHSDHVAIAPAVATLFAVLVYMCLQEPIPDYDSLSYHLPVMAQWAQTGSLAMPEWTAPLGLTHVARYPFSWEALATIPLVTMGDDSFVSLPGGLAWLWYRLSVTVLAERLGARREHALAAACVTLCVPAVAGNVNTMRVEVPFSAAHASASTNDTRLGVRSGLSHRLADFVHAAVVQLSLPFVALVLASAGPVLWRNRSSASGTSAWRAGLSLAAIMLLAYVFTPFTGDNGSNGFRVTPWITKGLRFALPFVGAIGVAAALGMERWQPARTQTAVLVAGAALWEATRLSTLKVTLTAVSIALASAGLVRACLWLRTAQPQRRAHAAGGLVLVMIAAMLVAGAYQLRAVRNKHRVDLYGSVVAYVDEQTGPADVIGFLLTHQSYALHGSDLRGAVVAAPSAEDPSSWIDRLRQAHVTLVAVGPLLPDWYGSKELEWLSDQTRFERVCGSDRNREITLFKVR